MIRNYENPEGTISLIDSTSVTVPVTVFTSTNSGAPIGTALDANHPDFPGNAAGQIMAVTNIVLCNTAAPNISDETINAVSVNVYVVRAGKSAGSGNLLVSNLVVPAGETVFFSEEKMVLNPGDTIRIGTSASGILAVTVSALAI